MIRLSLLILIGSLGFTLGSNCRDISGLWRNQLGSNMTIHIMNDRITGEYRTAVESEKNAALITSNITGTFAALDDGSLLSFTVLFNRGKSLTTWVGQCLVCDGEEVLFTTWVLRSYNQKASDSWMVNHVNQDIFKRVKGSGNLSFHQSTSEILPNDKQSERCGKSIKATPKGKWVAESGDTLHFKTCNENGVLSGQYKNSSLFGRSDKNEHVTALGFISRYERRIKGWTGHIYGESNARILQTTWLQHSFSNNCKDPFSDVRLGMTNYTNEAIGGATGGPSHKPTLWQKILDFIKG